jgi:hypothetical protein
MKTYYFIIVCLCSLLLCSCGQEPDNRIRACGIDDPAKKLPWLAELINKAENDNSGNYLGTIWLEKYNEQDIFVTDMMFGSGGIMYYFFDCSGNHYISNNWEYENCPACDFVGGYHVLIENEEDFDSFVSSMKLDVVIYSPF